MKVHLLQVPEHLDLLREQLDPRISLTVGDVLPAQPAYEILVAGRPQRDHIEASADLQRVIIPFAGVPDTTRALLFDYPHIELYNLHHNAPIVAEMVLALLLAAAKEVVVHDQALRRGDWSGRYGAWSAVMLVGKTVLIVGYGAIGQRVGMLCQALGMTVIGIRRRDFAQPDALTSPAPALYLPSALHDLLPQADVLILTLPLTPETQGIIGERELALLPPKAILVNVGRGPLVEERALYQALKDGRLHAAASDVWYQYPIDEGSRIQTPPSRYPFGDLPNMILSPHRAGHTDVTEVYRMRDLATALNAAVRGAPIPNRVDLSAGY